MLLVLTAQLVTLGQVLKVIYFFQAKSPPFTVPYLDLITICTGVIRVQAWSFSPSQILTVNPSSMSQLYITLNAQAEIYMA